MVILITGATGAIGAAAVRQLQSIGHTVIGTSRRSDTPQYRSLDISSPASIESFAQGLEADGIRLDGLLHNAGTISRRYSATPEGFERVMATNYIGPCLLTRRLLPLMSDGATVVCTASMSCYVARLGHDYFQSSPDSYRQIQAYADSKLALVLFAQELHRRYGDRLRVRLTDPGIVNSRMLRLDSWVDPLCDLLFRPLCKTADQGAVPAVRALLHTPDDRRLLLFRGRRHRPLPHSWQDPALSRWLWEETGTRVNFICRSADNKK